MTNIIEIVVTAKNDTAGARDEIKSQWSQLGDQVGTEFSTTATESVKAGAQEFAAVGEQAGQNLMTATVAAIDSGGARVAEAGALVGTDVAAAISEKLRLGLDEEAQALMDSLPSTLEAGATSAGIALGEAITQGAGRGISETRGQVAAQAAAAMDAAGAQASRTAIDAGTLVGDDYSAALRIALNQGLVAFTALPSMTPDAIVSLVKNWQAQITQAAASAGTEALVASEPELVAAAEMCGQATAGAFVRSYGQSVSRGLADSGVAGSAFAELTPVFAQAGSAAGTEFSVAFSAKASAGIEQAQIAAFMAANKAPTLAGAGAAAGALGAGEAGAAGGLSRMLGGGMMGGPLGMVLWQLPWLLSMGLGGGGMFGGGQSGPTSAQQLATAVGQDQGGVGFNTAATIQSTLGGAGSGLQQQLGVPQSTLIEYAAGESKAQQQVTAAYNAKQAALAGASEAEGVHSKAEEELQGRSMAGANAAQQQSLALAGAKGSLDAETSSVAAAIAAQTANTQALMDAEGTTKIFQASLDSAYVSMQSTAQQAAINAVAMLNLGAANTSASMAIEHTVQAYQEAQSRASGYTMVLDALNNTTDASWASYKGSAQYVSILSQVLGNLNNQMVLNAQHTAQAAVAGLNLGQSQSGLNEQLIASVTAYQEATAQASDYNTILQATNGTAQTVAGAQNTLAQDTLNAATSFAKNKDSLDLNTQAGITNRQALVAAAQAIQAMGIAQEQATGNVGSANQLIEQQITAFVNATGATGKAKDAIDEYLTSLIQIPATVTTTVNVVTNGAYSAPGGGRAKAAGGPIGAAAAGGPQDGWTQINEDGRELVNLPTGATVMPHANTESMLASGAGGGLVRLEWGGGPSGGLESVMWEWFKKQVSIKGGRGPNSAQRALGTA